jgi:hypothetical protein
MNQSFRSEPFLWIHLAGIAIAPLALQLTWLGLAVGDPLPFPWLELFVIGAIGIFPLLWMQWQRPFDIFSLLLFALKPDLLTDQQRQILSAFKGKKQQIASVFGAVGMAWIFWQLYRLAPLAAIAASFLPQWRILGLAIASIAFLASNLFVQVPVAVLSVLLTKENQVSGLVPYPSEKISQSFTVPGIKVAKILPISTQR